MTGKKVLIFGAGYSALAFARANTDPATKILGTTRSPEKFETLRRAGINPIGFGDAADICDEISEVTHLIVSIPPDETGRDPGLHYSEPIEQWTNRLEWIGYLSTVGVYGDHAGVWVDETTVCRPVSKRSTMRVAAEKNWLKLGKKVGVPVAVLRLSGIYGPGRNALVNLENGSARRLVKPDQVFNRIHCDDIAGALWHLAGGNTGGIFNVTDDEPAPPQDVVTYAASLMGVTPPPEIPFETAQLSPMARSFYGENKRVANKVIKAAGYQFRYPDYRKAFDQMWADGSWRDGEPRSPMKGG